jgi:peptide/nickel transport system substrate-binding protein
MQNYCMMLTAEGQCGYFGENKINPRGTTLMNDQQNNHFWTRRNFLGAAAAGIAVTGANLTAGVAFAEDAGVAPTGPATGSVTFLSAENLSGKWNPYNHTLLSQLRLQAAAYDLLIFTDEEGKYVPGLALSWSNPEPSVWEFKLRPEVKFHDGAPFTAKDVKASIEYNSDPAQGGSFFFPGKFTCDVVDDLTVKINTGAPYAAMPALLACGGPVISPAHIIAEGKLDEKFVGTGPYKWVSYEGEEVGVKLTANDEYWGPKAHIKDYIFRFVGDSQTRLAALQSGQAQIIDRVEPDQIAAIEGDPKLAVQRVNTVESKWLTFRVANAPMDNPKLRQAIAHAIDVPSIVQFILMGSGEVNTSFLTAAQNFSEKSGTFPTYDPEKAKLLLAEAGYPNGQGLRELTYYVSVGFYPKTREYGQLIVQNLADIGIKVNLQTLEVAKYNQLLFDPKAGDLFDHGWFIASRDPEVMLSSLFRTALVTKVKSPKNVEVLEKESAMTDPAARAAYFKDTVLPTLETELYEFPMFASQLVTAQTKALKGFTVPPTAYARIEKAWLS